jgi:hypothetical protein
MGAEGYVSLLGDIVGLVGRSRKRIARVEHAVLGDVYGAFSRMRVMMEQDLHSYLRVLDHTDLSAPDRVRLTNSFPFTEILANNMYGLMNELGNVEQRTAARLQEALQADFGEYEHVFWSRERHIIPPGWADDVMNSLDWNKLGAFLSYIRSGGQMWLNRWGAEAPAQLGAGVMNGEPVSTIVQRITGVNVNTPEGQAALGRKVYQGMAVNAAYAVVQAANMGKNEAYKNMEEKFDLGLKEMWHANVPTACPLCLRLHGTVIGLNEEFPWRVKDHPKPYLGHLAGPPRHPRCMCSTSPWSDDWEALTEFTPDNLRDQAQQEMEQRFPQLERQERTLTV